MRLFSQQQTTCVLKLKYSRARATGLRSHIFRHPWLYEWTCSKVNKWIQYFKYPIQRALAPGQTHVPHLVWMSDSFFTSHHNSLGHPIFECLCPSWHSQPIFLLHWLTSPPLHLCIDSQFIGNFCTIQEARKLYSIVSLDGHSSVRANSNLHFASLFVFKHVSFGYDFDWGRVVTPWLKWPFFFPS